MIIIRNRIHLKSLKEKYLLVQTSGCLIVRQYTKYPGYSNWFIPYFNTPIKPELQSPEAAAVTCIYF